MNWIRRLFGYKSNEENKINQNKSELIKFETVAKTQYLSDYEIKIFNERVHNFLQKEKYEDALKLTTQIINSSSIDIQHLIYFVGLRRIIYNKLEKWDLAIADVRTSIELNPDFSDNYISMGAMITLKLFYTGNYRIDKKNEILNEAIYYYNECLKRNPSNPTAWTNIIETYIFLQQWDDAISYYGACKPYMIDKDDKLIRAFLGCLSLALAGENIEDEDIELLLETKTQYATEHDSNQIRDVLTELERIQFDTVKVETAKDIYKKFKRRIKSTEF